jgi:hypothetical protein
VSAGPAMNPIEPEFRSSLLCLSFHERGATVDRIIAPRMHQSSGIAADNFGRILSHRYTWAVARQSETFRRCLIGFPLRQSRLGGAGPRLMPFLDVAQLMSDDRCQCFFRQQIDRPPG